MDAYDQLMDSALATSLFTLGGVIVGGTATTRGQVHLERQREIAEAAGCSKASESDIRRGKWTPHVSTWAALGELVGVEMSLAAFS